LFASKRKEKQIIKSEIIYNLNFHDRSKLEKQQLLKPLAPLRSDDLPGS
jgi:hypothetical protein